MQSQLLKLALPLVREHGFTRQALSLSVLHLPSPHTQPLSDTAINALFGKGEDARRTLINAWLVEGKDELERNVDKLKDKSVGGLLKSRLRWNDSALQHLPEAFALLASPSSGIPPLDPRPALQHAVSIADQACFLSGDRSIGNQWYTKRATLAAVYMAAELHQLSSPTTADAFLDELLDSAKHLESVVSDSSEFGRYVSRSWAGIIRSLGIV